MTHARSVRIGTRASALALWQAQHVAQAIGRQADAPTVELLHIRTEGDLRTDVPLWTVGGRAFFTKEIDRALAAGEIDIAVHSLKDLATTLEPGLELAAVLTREDPRDAFVSLAAQSFRDLPAGARVGSSSLRRRAFLARARSDLRVVELRGNVPTRVERLRAGAYDAIILAAAGLHRLGLEGAISSFLSVEDFPPAVSQGAIGVCVRADDVQTAAWVRPLDDAAARLTTTAERALLRTIEGGCQVPLGALATLAGASLTLQATVCALDGSASLSAQGTIEAQPGNAALLGERLARQLLEQGAGGLIATIRAQDSAVAAP